MKKQNPYHQSISAFTLIEVMTSVALFALVIVGFNQILAETIKAQTLNSKDKALLQELQNHLDSTLQEKSLSTGSEILNEFDGESEIIITREVKPASISLKDNLNLNHMYQVTITANRKDSENVNFSREATIYVYKP